MTVPDPENNLSAQAITWLGQIHDTSLDIALLQRACEFVQKEALLQRGLAIASKLRNLHCDTETVVTAILYPSFHKAVATKQIIEEKFGEEITKLLIGTQHMETIDTLQSHHTKFSQRQNQIDNLRKMLLAIVDDFRIVLIKLAERLVNLIYLKQHYDEKELHIAHQAMDLYAPLANQLGVGQFKWEMEDLAFEYINPGRFREISKAVNMQHEEREAYVKKVIIQIKKLLNENNIFNTEISGRVKHIYSIYRKIQRKEVDFSKIYDASAVRILVKDLKDCYTVLSVVHNEWPHIPEEFDDYIAKPKPNGYRSIHTAVIGPDHRNIEIQIRTYQMHEESELGVAAHWKYKENRKKSSTYEEKINWFRQVMQWQEEVSKDSIEQKNAYKSLFEDRVFVFTPNGDILDMRAGATSLDFAYHIHTDVGHHCRGVKINGVMVPLTQSLKNGDRIEILTMKTGHPSRDWLNPHLGYLKTPQAIAKVRHWFKHEDFQDNLSAGQALWEKTYRHENLQKNILDKIYPKFNFGSVEDLLAALGAGNIGIITLLNRIKTLTAPQKETKTPLIYEPTPNTSLPPAPAVNVESVGNLLTQLAQCCQPIPGDEIIGYITKGRGISIHQAACYNIKQALKHRPERIIDVTWGAEFSKKFPVSLFLEVDDRSGLIRDISNVIANEKVHILSLNTRVNKLKRQNTISLTIEITRLDLLEKIIRELTKIPEVNVVKRKK